MGALCTRAEDPDHAWKRQNREAEHNPMYKIVGLKYPGCLIDNYDLMSADEFRNLVAEKLEPMMYNKGAGAIITKEMYRDWLEKNPHASSVKTCGDEDYFEVNDYMKVRDHEACWDLNKRGGVGETPLHMCFLNHSETHMKVAKVMLDMYPKLSLDIYEAEAYYGESCLHFAIVNNDLAAVKMLIGACNANPLQRTTGSFFLPEDQKVGKQPRTNYEGDAYYGEYPLSFAAAVGNMDIYDYLLKQPGASPNTQDSFGNSVLHILVIHNKPDMFQYCEARKREPTADMSIRNNAGYTPLQLAAKLGYANMFELILEIKSKKEMVKNSGPITDMLYPLEDFDSINDQGKLDWSCCINLVTSGNTEKHIGLLENKLFLDLLKAKWHCYARKDFIMYFVSSIVYLILLSIAIYLRHNGDLLVVDSPRAYVRVVVEVIVVLWSLVSFPHELLSMPGSTWYQYIKSLKRMLEKTICLFSCLLILLCIPLRFAGVRNWEDFCLAIAAPCAWIHLLFYCRGIAPLGPFITMIYRMLIHDLMKAITIFMIILIPYAAAFYMCFSGTAVETYFTFWGSNMALVQATFGHFEYQELHDSHNSGFVQVMFVTLMVTLHILLLNMLIAMMTNTYEKVFNRMEKEWWRQRARVIMRLEAGLLFKVRVARRKMYSVPLRTDGEKRGRLIRQRNDTTMGKMRVRAQHNWKKLYRLVKADIRAEQLRTLTTITVCKAPKKRGTGAGGNSSSAWSTLDIDPMPRSYTP